LRDKNPKTHDNEGGKQGARQSDPAPHTGKRIALHDAESDMERKADCQERKKIETDPVSELQK
jgi:hypothetical protein